MTKAIKKIKDKKTRFLTCALIAGIIIIAGLYVYFINATIKNIALINETKKELIKIRMEQYKTEKEYLGLISNITIEQAIALGFTDKGERVFVSANEAVAQR